MSKRANLPYTTQDLFPQVGGSNLIHNENLSPPKTIRTNSVTSNLSSNLYIPRSTSNFHSNNSTFSFNLKNYKTMFKRLLKPNTLDFETAIWEIFHLIINPKKMYRSHYYYKQSTSSTKSSYTRDDPSFLILLTGFLSISAIAWGLAYSPTIIDILKLVIYMVFIDFYLTGIIISTITWIVTNKLFNLNINKYNINYIEWSFCFDIHCNSFLIIWCLLYVLQFLLLPIIRMKNIVALILGNSLYFGSIGYYFIVTFYGFNSLPFISSNINNTKSSSNKNPAKVLQLVVIAGILPLLAIGWLITLILRCNVADKMVSTYFN
ncbi:unnamed protein product [Candida verbasci]|uniref:Protein GMH1 n=1 Tax=Candida verbasci TaxID=1227364 RepID=A0A9W4X9F4_9ASCO|nr:unnamed protein product [Candida verbasci]